MRQRSFIRLMLAVIALQGTGGLHSLHLAVAHMPADGHGHGGSASTPASDEITLHARDADNCVSGHHHDPATCRVCQALASCKVMVSTQVLGLWHTPLAAMHLSGADPLALSQADLAPLGPRAPPRLGISASV